MENVSRVVLGLEEPEIAEEVMHFLDRSGRARVVATASDERQLAEAIRQLEPDAIVASPGLVRSTTSMDGSVLLAVDTVETVGVLRGALRAGARGFYLWPNERDQLAGATARALRSTDRAVGRRGLVLAVYGARGGVGTTFLATHLAEALAKRGRACVLVDLDLQFADVTHAIGVPSDEPVRTLTDLAPLVDELTTEHLDEILWTHPGGFRVLLAPGEEDAASSMEAGTVQRCIEAIAWSAEVVVLHVPRGIDGLTRAVLGMADRVVIVLTLDVLSFRAAKRAIAAVGVADRCEFVVNAARKGEIAPADVERVFGTPPVAVIPTHHDVRIAQDRGRLLPIRGRVGRAVDRLAGRLLEEHA